MATPPRIAEIDALRALVLLDSGWRPEYAKTMKRENLSALSLRITDDDLSFLQEVPPLRGLVLNAGAARDLSAVEQLTELESLTLNTVSRPRMTLDFKAFPNLRHLGVYWNPGFDSIFECQRLETLYVFGPPDPDLERFGSLTTLRRLEVSQGRRLTTTRGVERLSELRFLGLYSQSSLSSLTGVGELGNLEHLEIEGCRRIEEIGEVAALRSLTSLMLNNCGDIDTLRPLERLAGLERFLAWESTNVRDGDLEVLLRLPRLREIAMKERRTYSPSVAQVEAALDARAS